MNKSSVIYDPLEQEIDWWVLNTIRRQKVTQRELCDRVLKYAYAKANSQNLDFNKLKQFTLRRLLNESHIDEQVYYAFGGSTLFRVTAAEVSRPTDEVFEGLTDILHRMRREAQEAKQLKKSGRTNFVPTGTLQSQLAQVRRRARLRGHG